MDRITATYLNRGIELLLLVVLWRAYSDCRCAHDLWLSFARQSELHQIGTLTAIAIIARALLITAREALAAGSKVAGSVWRSLAKVRWP
ncbi:hypothetical protein ABS767_12195 [Sphingomonas sp. ST-64]|uniref:Uncharacterized protein n=1 Tax=Sphingomonas plantiphila TaxID=3163295 RepID=A0ABW8YQ15_9SPHN